VVSLSRRKVEEEDITSFWLITYSDMATLLLTFFLLMYSFSVMQERQKQDLVQQLNQVSENAGLTRKQKEELEQAAREIAAQFQKDETFVESTETEVTVGLSSAVTFASGDDALSPAGREALVKAAAILARLPNTIRVEGHTDDVPVRGGRLGSNWALSASRAQSVVRLFLERGVEPRRLQVIGFGEGRPRQPNVDEASRAANRRIEIKIIRKGSSAEG
jgi:chemotaxis protein MotB